MIYHFNTYLCPTLHRTAVIESDEGKTPYLIQCPECGKLAKSEVYSYKGDIIPTHEFYMPKIEYLGTLSEQELLRYKNNVLFIRKIS
jgi:hypothetical protein